MTREEAIKGLTSLLEVRRKYGDIMWADEIETLEMAIKALEQTRWIPVSERLPKDNASYLVTVKQGYIMIGIWCGNPEYWENVIAWMPLPSSYQG